MKRVVFITLAVVAALYAGDYAVARYRMAKGENLRGTVVVQRYYAIAEKNNKVEFTYDQPDIRECSNSLFPRFGDSACWYARFHKEERIDE